MNGVSPFLRCDFKYSGPLRVPKDCIIIHSPRRDYTEGEIFFDDFYPTLPPSDRLALAARRLEDWVASGFDVRVLDRREKDPVPDLARTSIPRLYLELDNFRLPHILRLMVDLHDAGMDSVEPLIRDIVQEFITSGSPDTLPSALILKSLPSSVIHPKTANLTF